MEAPTDPVGTKLGRREAKKREDAEVHVLRMLLEEGHRPSTAPKRLPAAEGGAGRGAGGEWRRWKEMDREFVTGKAARWI